MGSSAVNARKSAGQTVSLASPLEAAVIEIPARIAADPARQTVSDCRISTPKSYKSYSLSSRNSTCNAPPVEIQPYRKEVAMKQLLAVCSLVVFASPFAYTQTASGEMSGLLDV